MEKDRKYLAEIKRCCERIITETAKCDDPLQTLESNLAFQESVLFNLIQIGESVNKLSDELKENTRDMHWHEIVGMRNVITHGYGAVDLQAIKDTIVEDIPHLYNECNKLDFLA